METILEKAKLWLSEVFDDETRSEVQQLIETQSEDLTDRFYKDLEFGTGGIRGVMGVGTNRINRYTLGKTTQGLSNYLHKTYKNNPIKVVIAYDCRHNSKELANVVAAVLSANNIHVFLFEDLRPTPELSFAVTHLNCQAGIVLTASHNPPEYNGYKVYGSDGGQIVPPQDTAIIDAVNALTFSDINFEGNEHLITKIGKEVDEAFWKACIQNGQTDVKNRDGLRIVFTPLHGTAITAIPQVLKKAGYTQVHIVEAQATPNGDFPTVQSPNPEEPEALEMAIDLAKKQNADIVLATDPDSDRIGVAVRNTADKWVLLNGNQTMAVLVHFLLKKRKKQGTLNGKQFIGSTIVSSPLISKITDKFGVETKLGLTGFKWIAKMIKDHPELECIAGGEESYGFMVGDFLRDKDAVTTALLACEIATEAKENGHSLYHELLDIYKTYGFYKETLISVVKKGIKGAQEIQKMMLDFRTHPLTTIDGENVVLFEDYQSSIRKNLLSGAEQPIDLPKSNVLIFETEKGTRVACRPSGTEPKIKFYISVNKEVSTNIVETEADLQSKITRIINELHL